MLLPCSKLGASPSNSLSLSSKHTCVCVPPLRTVSSISCYLHRNELESLRTEHREQLDTLKQTHQHYISSLQQKHDSKMQVNLHDVCVSHPTHSQTFDQPPLSPLPSPLPPTLQDACEGLKQQHSQEMLVAHQTHRLAVQTLRHQLEQERQADILETECSHQQDLG